MTIIDDYSRRVWIYTLKYKYEALDRFKKWLLLVENQTNRKLKKLRTDNGLEFCSKEFNNFCSDRGIARHHTVPYTPQQNGLAKRMNRTILERVRCVLLYSGVPKSFWAEAATTVCYLINKSPSVPLNFLTPLEKWTGHSPQLNNLKVFGCAAYAHVKQGKLDPRALKCIFFGYPEGIKGYKLWCIEPGMNKTIISRDVTFREDIFPYKVTEGPIDSLVKNDSTEITKIEVELKDDHPEATDNVLTEDDEPETESQTIDNLESYQLARDRKRRIIKPPQRLGHADLISYAFSIASQFQDDEPINLKEAMNSNDKDQWYKAMSKEIESLEKRRIIPGSLYPNRRIRG